MLTYLDTVHFDTYVTAVAGRSGVRVVWDEPGTTPRTDGATLWVPRITSGTSADALVKLRYYIKHECEHIVHTAFTYWEKNRGKGLLAFLINLIEDNRIDYINDHTYRGDVSLSNAFWELRAQDIDKGGPLTPAQELILPLFVWDSHNRDWIASAPLLRAALCKGLSSVGADKVAKLMPYGERLQGLRHSPLGATSDLLALAQDIIKNVFGEDPATMEKKSEGGEGDGKGKGEGDEGEGDKPSTSDDDSIIEVGHLSPMNGDHVEHKTGISCAVDISSGGYPIPASKDYLVIGFPFKATLRTKDGGIVAEVSRYFESEGVKGLVSEESRPLVNKLRQRLQVRALSSFEYGRKSGALHAGSLHRLVSARGTAQEGKVFKRSVTNNTLDTAVSLLVDCSGSMSGKKFKMAAAASLSMSAALTPLGISHSVLGFTNALDVVQSPLIWLFKEWAKTPSLDEMVSRFSIASASLYDNSDGDAVAWAHNDLMQRTEKRRVLIVLSDGAPAGRHPAIGSYTKDVIESIENKNDVEVYGLGILDSNVTRFYTKHSVINSVSDLAPSLLSLLDKVIK